MKNISKTLKVGFALPSLRRLINCYIFSKSKDLNYEIICDSDSKRRDQNDLCDDVTSPIMIWCYLMVYSTKESLYQTNVNVLLLTGLVFGYEVLSKVA